MLYIYALFLEGSYSYFSHQLSRIYPRHCEYCTAIFLSVFQVFKKSLSRCIKLKPYCQSQRTARTQYVPFYTKEHFRW